MIRRATARDLAMLETLQRFVPAPAPELLEPAAGAKVILTTADPADGTRAADADERDSTEGQGGSFGRGGLFGRGVPVGYLLWLPGDPVYVAELVVAPEFRREGRARALFVTMVETLSPGTRVRLQVAESNDAARSLYRSLGFAPVGRDAEAYEEETGIWMESVVG